MTRNIVICSDGTGNSFQRHESNVARLVQYVALDNHAAQVVVYDQGIGTDGLYDEGDRVFLFGFSRGAFTVRTLAGLLYRCGLPPRNRYDDAQLFARAWALYQPMQPARDAIARFRTAEHQRECRVHFLGVWDTVKSYGGLRPVMLPHLRHNPIVHAVRHAVALDEQRGWFDVTTWGRLDLDRRKGAAWGRLSDAERSAIERQDIREVWFRGCHSDVGGGNGDPKTERIALRWMLGEAVANGIAINEAGKSLLAPPREPECAEIHESHTGAWRAVERVPRLTIDNSGTWPRRVRAPEPNALRVPSKLVRDGQISVHESVPALDALPPALITRVETRGFAPS